MVPLNQPKTNLILKDIVIASREMLNNILPESVDSAFVAWIYPNDTLGKPSLPRDFVVTNYSHVSQLAFLMELEPEKFSEHNSLLIEGLTRTSQRAAIISGVGPAAFCSDAIALLGIALGAKRVGGEIEKSIKHWLHSVVGKPLDGLPDWKKTDY